MFVRFGQAELPSRLWVLRERHLAVAMGQHQRLGSSSLLMLLDCAVLREVPHTFLAFFAVSRAYSGLWLCSFSADCGPVLHSRGGCLEPSCMARRPALTPSLKRWDHVSRPRGRNGKWNVAKGWQVADWKHSDKEEAMEERKAMAARVLASVQRNVDDEGRRRWEHSSGLLNFNYMYKVERHR